MKNLYQTPPPVGENPVIEALENLSRDFYNFKAKVTNDGEFFTKNHQTFKNVVFIGDSFGAGYYYGYDPTKANLNNYQYHIAEMLGLTSYQRFNKGGLCFNSTSSNNLTDFITTDVSHATDPESVDNVILCVGVNDSVLNNKSKTVEGLQSAIPALFNLFPNATINYFYSPVVAISEARSVAAIQNAFSYSDFKKKILTHFSPATYLTGESSLYSKGGEDSVYHPNALGAPVIAAKMTAELLGGKANNAHRFYISAEHTSSEELPFDMHGGLFLTALDDGVEVSGRINIFRKSTYANNYILLPSQLSEFIVGTSSYLTIPAFDSAVSYLSYAIDLNFDTKAVKICKQSGAEFPATSYIQVNAFIEWNAMESM